MATRASKEWILGRVNDLTNTFHGVGVEVDVSPSDIDETIIDSDGKISDLLASLREAKNNKYLQYAESWNNIDLPNIAEGTALKEEQKNIFDTIISDLSTNICAQYSYGPTGTCEQAQTPTFNQNSANASFNQKQTSSFNQSQTTSFNQNSTNVTFTENSNTAFTQNSTNQTGSGFTQDSSNQSGFGQNFNATTFTAYTEGYSGNTCSAHKGSNYASFTLNSSNIGFGQNTQGSGVSFGNNTQSTFSQDSLSSFTFNGSNHTFTFNSSNQTFTFNSSNHTFTFNSSLNSGFAFNSANFSQNFNYSFMVKGDGTVVSNSNTTP